MRLLLALAIAVFAENASAQLIPADRNFAWNPGMTSKGGIPARATVCATLQAGNGVADDSARVQATLNNCAPGQVVQLAAGTFVINRYLMMSAGITLRGAGAGVTTLHKTNGSPGRN